MLTPIVCASPHSGRHYPEYFARSAIIDHDALRSSEDVLVDVLIERAPYFGASLITATYARAYVDLNREPYELDQDMFIDEFPSYVKSKTARVAAGLGSIAKIVGEGREIYGGKLAFDEARRRIETVHRPYHRALQGLLDDACGRHGCAVLLDWHSMPSAAGTGAGDFDVVLGDRFGVACAPRLTMLVEAIFRAEGYTVARNAPYAGGYTTEHYGRPAAGVHALQIELSRALYLEVGQYQPSAGFGRLAQSVNAVLEAVAREDWSALATRA